MNVVSDSVHLFDVDGNLEVRVREVGQRNPRLLLMRSAKMEEMIIEATDQLVHDWQTGNNEFDGLIYLMFQKGPDGEVVPLYIGKTETMGKGDQNLSCNIERLSPTNRGKFARWGDGYQYHIGDLSAVVLGHPEKKQSEKYKAWAEALYTEFPVRHSQPPKLKHLVYFWAKTWRKNEIGPWEELGPTNLSFVEYLLIGVASAAYPETVLNRHGKSSG